MPAELLRAVEKIYRKSRGLLWQARYGFPARGMHVIAVTGTNGKTTTISYINEILKAAGYKTAVLNTVFYEVAGKRTRNTTHFTVDKQSIVQSFFARAKRAKVDYVILEVTSHALDQDRIMGVKIDIALITNLTQDHLDYHKTMKNYARAKSLLLRNYGAKYGLLNADDEWFEYFRGRSSAEVVPYGKAQNAKIKITEVKLNGSGASARLIYGGQKLDIATRLPGEFNVYNASAAVGVGFLLEIKPEDIKKGVYSLAELSGRMEEITARQDFRVFVDFAITPDAIEKALAALKKISKGKVRVVFGATGDRDREKRAYMGRVAAKLADAIYLTDDETYTEDPEKIREAVMSGIRGAKGAGKTKVIPDRKQAMKQAFQDAGKGDSVLITGLGHEDSRNMGGRLVPWSDQKVARELLKNI